MKPFYSGLTLNSDYDKKIASDFGQSKTARRRACVKYKCYERGSKDEDELEVVVLI